jgi:hypothetical protein
MYIYYYYFKTPVFQYLYSICSHIPLRRFVWLFA